MNKRRIFFYLASLAPVLVHAACASSNGEPIPNEVYDASPLDTGGNPLDPDGGSVDGARADGATDGGVTDAPADGPVSTAILINEIYVDTIGDGDGSEFVELRAAPGTTVDDLKLRLIGPNGKVRYEVAAGLAGDKVGASGRWVVGGNQTFRLNVVDRVDRTVPLATWGLDYPGAVQLVRGTTLLDVVGWTDVPDGGAVAPDPTLSPPTATAEGKPAALPDNSGATNLTKRKSFGRRGAPDGGALPPDTNDNKTDFCVMEASPGYAQKACL